MLFRRFAGRLLKSGPELQIGVMQLAREGSPPLGLCLPQTKLSRKYNQVARGRIRQFESYMPSQAVGLPTAQRNRDGASWPLIDARNTATQLTLRKERAFLFKAGPPLAV
jgi:hypothetical protein